MICVRFVAIKWPMFLAWFANPHCNGMRADGVLEIPSKHSSGWSAPPPWTGRMAGTIPGFSEKIPRPFCHWTHGRPFSGLHRATALVFGVLPPVGHRFLFFIFLGGGCGILSAWNTFRDLRPLDCFGFFLGGGLGDGKATPHLAWENCRFGRGFPFFFFLFFPTPMPQKAPGSRS